MAICIYCREPLTGADPREHLIPRGFGTFNPDLTLHCVCSTCNGFFGRTLEWPMRDASIEGALRLQHGLDYGVVGSLGTQGIEFKVAEEGDWFGARVAVRRQKGDRDVSTVVLPQVGARRNKQDAWIWYTEKEIRHVNFVVLYPKGSEFRFIGPTPADNERLIERIKKAGVDYVHGGTLNSPVGSDGKVELSSINDFKVAVRRCIAKIGFNYLAYVCGPDFVLSSDFDRMRSFTRYGIEPTMGVDYLMQDFILANERLAGSQITDGHVVTVEWSPNNLSVIGNLALFNSLRYKIVLSPHHDGIWSEISRGHHFDIHSRKAQELAAVRPTLLKF